MTPKQNSIRIFIFTLLLGVIFNVQAQNISPLEGRWDLEMDFMGKTSPSWLEIRHSGHATLLGRFVFAFGSARPISEVKTYGENKFTFSIPNQWEPKGSDMIFHGELVDDQLKGTLIYTDGSVLHWTGVKAPTLAYTEDPKWDKTIKVFNGKDLSGWHVDGEKNQWTVKDGILTSPESGSNFITDQKFQDFKLHAEFRFPKGSNSGIYLRGRYEVQIVDSEGLEPADIYIGGVYGFLEPNQNAGKPGGEWQTYDITLIGNRVTIELNGKTIISDATIPGITGGALDSKEGEPGSFMIQGDHGPVEFRSFEVTPLKK
ncbi:3-keto-disaccharide hydrolase [Flagellimonas zhangzhouensis]|uniref:3-keto-alpha-glucoside-1,2-lyase/3-keto-2-hydroxy-glucal hydratase domain-containing protein n=1 Tax=Flagellimonas zhangzhouensis TaxID=1073328 RepID=A0A1H2SJN7_9FLAO|nr:DUF1080 domain-containing protein [Allomuricauda zhangzhouensis]SDQ75697.1 protein of unknown function [Allomuricauda zhangzhouensis]SDW31846.1 protein of unknown function [Allomuricauda zhangzhouensis]